MFLFIKYIFIAIKRSLVEAIVLIFKLFINDL